MPKKSKLTTPEWILKGYGSKEKYEEAKGISLDRKAKKAFTLKLCPKCESEKMQVILYENKKTKWECKKCGWSGTQIKEKNLTEDEFMKYLDEKGEELPDESELKKDFKRTIESSDEEDFEE